MKMDFTMLPSWIRVDVIQNVCGLDVATDYLSLDERQQAKIDSLSMDEVFDSWLEWTGILGYTSQIKQVYAACFGEPITDLTFEAPTILKLYTDADLENYLAKVGFNGDDVAKKFVRIWEKVGGSVAWSKCGYKSYDEPQTDMMPMAVNLSNAWNTRSQYMTSMGISLNNLREMELLNNCFDQLGIDIRADKEALTGNYFVTNIK